MPPQDLERKPAAILCADVAGYSRLMQDDEEATIRTLREYRGAIANLTEQYRGRVVDSPGDRFLAEFASVVDSVDCAVEIQRELAKRNAQLTEERSMVFRIGVNLGDVVTQEERIHEDGVNIAAFMSGLAQGGGICLSGTVYDAIEGKTGLEYEYLGEKEVEDIANPVRAYRVVMSTRASGAHREMVDEIHPQYVRQERSGRLPFSTKLFQGIGAIPDTVKTWVFNTFTLLYYHQILELNALYVSVALAIAIVFDAVTDPLVASISDNLKSRWGRRHPLMLVAALPLGASLFAVFMPPPGLSGVGLFVWLLVFTVLTRAMMTLFFVPWTAIAAELSDDYDERTSIMSYRFAVGWTIGVLMPLLVYSFVMPTTEEYPAGQLNPAAYPGLALLAGCLVIGGALATTLLTLREIPFLRQPVGKAPGFSLMRTWRELKLALQNKQFALIFTIVMLTSAIGGTVVNINIYMTTFFWGLTSRDLRWYTLAAVGAIVAFPMVAAVQRRWDKKNIVLTCAVISLVEGLVLVNLRFLGVLPENGEPMLLVVLVAVSAIGYGVAVISGIIFASIVADLVDDQELRTGYRQEAMFNAALSFSGKAVSGLGTLFSGLIITLIDFPTHVAPTDVPAESLRSLGIVVGVVVPLLHLLPFFLITRYRITRARHAEIKTALEARRSSSS
jgi:Na+/melibiose symporter-like transporter/class 3 adenylate cyclase